MAQNHWSSQTKLIPRLKILPNLWSQTKEISAQHLRVRRPTWNQVQRGCCEDQTTFDWRIWSFRTICPLYRWTNKRLSLSRIGKLFSNILRMESTTSQDQKLRFESFTIFHLCISRLHCLHLRWQELSRWHSGSGLSHLKKGGLTIKKSTIKKSKVSDGHKVVSPTFAADCTLPWAHTHEISHLHFQRHSEKNANRMWRASGQHIGPKLMMMMMMMMILKLLVLMLHIK